MIEAFLAKPVPADWVKWDTTRRDMFWASPSNFTGELVPRDKTCAQEIWRECLHESRAAPPRNDAMRINAVLDRLAGWEKLPTPRQFGPYGNQKGYALKESEISATFSATFSENKAFQSSKVAEASTTKLLSTAESSGTK